MATPHMIFRFEVGDTVARTRDTWRKGTVTKIDPARNEVHVLWAIKTTIVGARKLTLIDRTNKPEDK